MANIKSAKKRVLTNAKKAERNQAVRSGVKTAVKKVRVAIEAGDKAAAEKVLRETTAVIDKAEKEHCIQKGFQIGSCRCQNGLIFRFCNLCSEQTICASGHVLEEASITS